jgi:hypothetical protein
MICVSEKVRMTGIKRRVWLSVLELVQIRQLMHVDPVDRPSSLLTHISHSQRCTSLGLVSS